MPALFAFVVILRNIMQGNEIDTWKTKQDVIRLLMVHFSCQLMIIPQLLRVVGVLFSISFQGKSNELQC